MLKQINFIALVSYCAFIYWLSDQQRLPTPNLFENEDKLHHFLAYFVMGVLSWRAFVTVGLSNQITFITAVIFCSAYGLSDEWHQSFVPGREPSVLDWSADSIGGLMAAIMCNWHARQTA